MELHKISVIEYSELIVLSDLKKDKRGFVRKISIVLVFLEISSNMMSFKKLIQKSNCYITSVYI